MDMFQPNTAAHRELQEALAMQNDELRREAVAQAQLASQMGAPPPPAVVFGQEEALGRWNARKSNDTEIFPINDH